MTRSPTNSAKCADFARWPKAQGEDVIAMVRDFEELPDITRLMKP